MTAVEMISPELDERITAGSRTRIHSIVVATDGSDAALAAFTAAKLICGKNRSCVHVLSVLEPITLFPTPDGILLPPDFDQSREEGQQRIVAEQIRKFDATNAWTIDLRLGRPARVIVEFAKEKQADLIIIAANRHGVLGRILGEETAMEIARLTDVPLLIASSGLKRVPARVVVAMDLNIDGMQKASQAMQLLGGSSSISLVHVQPRSEFMGIDWAEFDGEYEAALRDRFRVLEKDFEAAGMRADLVVLHGDVSRELADFAEYSKAELLVVGVRRRRGRSRAIGGRMASRMIRQASCSVLIVPSVLPLKSAAPK
jgi:nucleotide-binding universal stress UspA family protein